MPADSTDLCDNSSEPPSKRSAYQSHWLWFMCLVGLDYMSTLGYVPSIAFDAAGRLAPLAMAGLVVVTLFGALPVYCYLAGRSPNGQGSLILLERLIPGWFGKLLILILLGFAATDLIFTRTFSAADAAEHVLHSPEANWQRTIGQLSEHWEQNRNDVARVARQISAKLSSRQLMVTILLLGVGLVIAVVFRKGFRKRFIQIAVGTVAVYVVLNALLIGFGIAFLLERPELIEHWRNAVQAGDWQARSVSASGAVDAGTLGAAALALFPKVARSEALSGFEMAMLLMPLVRGRPKDDPDRPKGPHSQHPETAGRLCRRDVSFLAQLIAGHHNSDSAGSVFALDGQAKNRALAYLAHGGELAGLPGGERIAPFVGLEFGTIYDFSTVAILCLAGVSVSLVALFNLCRPICIG